MTNICCKNKKCRIQSIHVKIPNVSLQGITILQFIQFHCVIKVQNESIHFLRKHVKKGPVICGLFTIYIKTPSGFRLCKWNAKLPIGKSSSEHRLTISDKTGRDWKYIAKDLELDGKPRKMGMGRNRPVETSQLVKEDNLLKQTVFFW